MNQKKVNRKLSCIFSTDVVGYSRLMEDNEESTVKSIEENKRLISRLIEEHSGRVVDAPGDNLLAEFSSVVKAVDCAVKIQKELKIKNSELLESRQMVFRIGINLGDVIEEDGRLYGSGVNIAARLEGLAKPGGIWISGTAYDQVKTKLNLGYEYLGEHNVKNITEPVRVYHVLMGDETARKVIGEKRLLSRIPHGISMAVIFLLIIVSAGLTGWIIHSHQPTGIKQSSIEPEQPPVVKNIKKSKKTIAVLPFVDFSPEKDQGYFVDGLSEELLNSLTKIPDLLVTARTSSFTFKGTDKTIQEIAGVLGVDNILEGSVRNDGKSLRITTQLIRAADGFHLWSGIYDRELKDIFTVQEDIANSVADKLKITLGIGQSLKQLGGTDDFEAYELYLVAEGLVKGYMGLAQALETVDAAIELDPVFALAWALKSILHSKLAHSTSPDLVSSVLDEGLNAAQRAIELEPGLGKAYLSLGSAYMMKGEFIEAEYAYQRGMNLTTESIDYFEYGLIWHYMVVGYLKKCNELLEEMRRNDPLQPALRAMYMLTLGYLGNMEQAEEEYKRGKKIFKNQWPIGDSYMNILRLGVKDVSSISEMPEFPMIGRIKAMAKELIESPDDLLDGLHQLYDSDENLSSNDFIIMACCAAYLGDQEFALNTIERSINLQTSGLFFIWTPIMREVRQLPRFKLFVREAGLVDYWNKFAWPDLCRSVGGGDFECD